MKSRGMKFLVFLAVLALQGTVAYGSLSYGWGSESSHFGSASSVKKVKGTTVIASQGQESEVQVLEEEKVVIKRAIVLSEASSARALSEKKPKIVRTGVKIVEDEEQKVTPVKNNKAPAATKTYRPSKQIEDTSMATPVAPKIEKAKAPEPPAAAADESFKGIDEPLPRFTQQPYHQPQPENVKATEPMGRELIDNQRPKESKGILKGDGMPRIHPHLGLLYVYDSNFLNRPNDEIGDFIFVHSPGLSMEIGKPDPDNLDYNRINASYTANIIRFMDETQNDAIDQDANLLIRYNYGKTTLGLQQVVQTRSDSTVDIGMRTQRDIYNTMLSAKYDVSDKTYVDLAASQFVTNYTVSSLSDSTEWTPQLMLNYKITPKVVLGLGPKIGWVDLEGNPNQFYQQALFRVLWQVSAKLALNATAGMEFRQWQEGAVGDSNTPVFTMGANWDPFDSTKTSVVVYRRNTMSASIQGSNFITTGVEASIRQRIIQKIYLGLMGSYEHADYFSTSNVFTTDRSDYYHTIRPSINYAMAEWGTVGAYYEYRRNESNDPELEFREHIYGIEASFRY